MTKIKKIKTGQILVITFGEYSDYMIMLTAVALQDFDISMLDNKYKKLDDYAEFLPWLIDDSGLVKKLADTVEINYSSSYSVDFSSL